MLRHEGVVNVAHAVIMLWKLTKADSIFQLSSLSFDACLLDICASLFSGARLHLWDGDWRAALPRSRSTILQATPTVFDIVSPSDLAGFRVLVPGGEVLSLGTAKKWTDTHLVFNAYGPTECSIEISEGFIQAHDEHIHIGSPHPRCVCCITSGDMQLCAFGQTGKLFLGGICVAAGYLHRPELTKARFITSPWDIVGVERLYCTGDLACWTHTGTLLLKGREDNQVKLRGFRIELGEVESTAQEFGVEAATAVIQNSGDCQHLVLFVKPEVVNVARLREHCSNHLPHYMLPHSIIAVQRFPMTTSDKTDRLTMALPDVEETHKVIRTHPFVRRCQVVDRTDAPGMSPDPLRVAYIQLQEEANLHTIAQTLSVTRDIERLVSSTNLWREPNAYVITNLPDDVNVALLPLPTSETATKISDADKRENPLHDLAEILAKNDTSIVPFAIDSMAAMNFARGIAGRFGINFTMQDLRSCNTLGKLRGRIDQLTDAQQTPSLVSGLAQINGFRGVLMISVILEHAAVLYGDSRLAAVTSNRDMTVMWFYVITAGTSAIQFRLRLEQGIEITTARTTFWRQQLTYIFSIYYIALIWDIALGLDVAGLNLVYFTGFHNWLFERTLLSHICPETRPTHWQGWPFLAINPFLRDGSNTDCAHEQPGNELWWVSTYLSLILLLPWVEPFIWRYMDTLFHMSCGLVATWMLCWMSFAFVVWTCVVDIIPAYWPDVDAIGRSCPYLEYCPPLHISYLLVGVLLGQFVIRQFGSKPLMKVSARGWGRITDISASVWISAQFCPPYMPLRISDPTRALVTDLALRPVSVVGFSAFVVALPFDELGHLAWPIFLLHRPTLISLKRLDSAGLVTPSGIFLYIFWLGLFAIIFMMARVVQSLQGQISFVSGFSCCPRTTKAML